MTSPSSLNWDEPQRIKRHQRSRRSRAGTVPRRLDALRVICEYARDNNGITPTTRNLAALLCVSQTRVVTLLGELEDEGYIEFVSRYTYKVLRSMWEPPTELDF